MHETLPTKTELTPPPGVEWRIDDRLVPYAEAVAAMERGSPRSAPAGRPSWSGCWSTRRSIPPAPAPGTRTCSTPDRFPVYRTGRGGQFTYHGPGQRVAYVMLDLKRAARTSGASSATWRTGSSGRSTGSTSRASGGTAGSASGSTRGGGREDKIAAIGVRIRRWVTFHGIAINVEPDLEHFAGIVPCGIAAANYGVTSLVDLGLPVTMADLDVALKETFAEVFGASPTS